MNVSQLLRGLIGDLRVSDAKALEVKVGEVVRGMVLKVLSNQEALMNINGVTIQARLETPLNQGQITMLQVQPESSRGLVVLRPLNHSQVKIAQQSLVELLHRFGLQDGQANRQLIQLMHQHSITINRSNVNLLANMLAQIPANTSTEQWIQASIVTMQRGLPLTVQSVSATHQVLFGIPVNQLVSQLQTQIGQWLQASPPSSVPAASSSTAAPTAAASTLLVSAQQLLSQLQINAQQVQSMATIQGNGSHEQAVQRGAVMNLTPSGNAAAVVTNLGAGSQENVTSSGTAYLAPNSAMNPTVNSPLLTNENQAAADKITNQAIATSASNEANASNASNTSNTSDVTQSAASNKASGAEAVITQTQMTAASGEAAASRVMDNATWISSLLKLLGVQHEQQTARFTAGPEMLNHDLQSGQANTGNINQSLSNLKSMLMQLSVMEELPASLRESAQQLLQHITGQQLFMTAERGSHFSHLTLFIPLFDQEGGQTAAINIQSRKGARGEIDAENCRMLFDLDMVTLGNMLIDVQVTSKLVSLHVHNDHELIAQLLEEGRESINVALEQAGYQLTTLKSSPYPEITRQLSDQVSTQLIMDPVKSSFYSAKPYKGVDVRI